MNLAHSLPPISRFLNSAYHRWRTCLLPRQQCEAFAIQSRTGRVGIGPIYVINLDRQPKRWATVRRELDRVLDSSRVSLSERLIRYSAFDARAEACEVHDAPEIDPHYTLSDQLRVEPQPRAVPDDFELERPIRMSHAEVAIARSHIGVWRSIARSDAAYALVLEDDVWFRRNFGRNLDRAWNEMGAADWASPAFDLLYLSYKEVRHGAPKELLSRSLFRPHRGLWYLSGYVLSKSGAQALLARLPCRGPIDLWINHQFQAIKVRALRRSVIQQRRDVESTNSYSVLPTLGRIGVLEGGAALFKGTLRHAPVFAFGTSGTGLSSLAMALSMLGYRCCSDLDRLPNSELQALLAGRADRVFNAYVNVDILKRHIGVLRRCYPTAKFITIGDAEASTDHRRGEVLEELHESGALRLPDHTTTWRALCEHLRLAPPDATYPIIPSAGQRRLRARRTLVPTRGTTKRLRHDCSPWVVEARPGWTGIDTSAYERPDSLTTTRACFDDDLTNIRTARWLLRNDTFPGNLGMFRSANVTPLPGGGCSLVVMQEQLGVQNLSAAALPSKAAFLFGRFEATLQATSVSGLVTGFFLHRDSPRQEIDVEIAGNRPDWLLVNVFYNPGTEGANYDYGYRGTPTRIPLGFDASSAPHRYALEWDPCEIRWFVDDKLVHRRVSWDPTPIPHLPMSLHMNSWPTRSRELAGRLDLRALPASARLHRGVALILITRLRGSSLEAVVG